jgi:mRNA-degrading endonuclease RelE of RelBE toxin-antitoxin system
MKLMQNESKSSQILVTPEFKRSLKILSKRYRHIRSDVQPIIEQLQSGEIMGDQIPNIPYTVFKVRIKNSDNQKGKSGGYRFIYYLKTSTTIVLVTIYSKSDQEDIAINLLKQIIESFTPPIILIISSYFLNLFKMNLTHFLRIWTNILRLPTWEDYSKNYPQEDKHNKSDKNCGYWLTHNSQKSS